MPSFWRRYQEKLSGLEEISSEVLLTAKASAAPVGKQEHLLPYIQQNWVPDSIVLGGLLGSPEGEVLDAFGEQPAIACDAVNIANRMEAHGIIDRIQVRESPYQWLKDKY